MTELTDRIKTVMAAVAVVAAVVAGLAAPDTALSPGPVPTCFGEQATIVLVKYQQLPGDTAAIREQEVAQSLAPFQEWTDAGVDVRTSSDALFVGTTGHDVMVSLTQTITGGFVSDKDPGGPKFPATAGDYMCSPLTNSDDVYYATKGYSDRILDSGGSDEYRLGGCYLEGEGSPGDRTCDEVHSLGPVGPFFPQDPPDGRDRVWGYKVPKGRVQIIESGDAWLHAYVGAGQGKVRVIGGGCFVRAGVGGALSPCSTSVKGGGDHVHPCPIDDNTVVDEGLEIKTSDGIRAEGIEYFGPESLLGLAPADQSDPCAYQQKTRSA